jgi:flavin reductase (DIM6/NTAB) family NADH-FMN oxidoreductase RutF
MRYVREFKGFGGIRIEADDIGSGIDPSVVILHDIGSDRSLWAETAEALVAAGRHAINIDLRGHGGSEWPDDGRYDLTAFVEDLREVLNQMRTRPVVVASGAASTIAMLALAEDAALLASGLALFLDPLGDSREPASDPRIRDRLTLGTPAELTGAAAKIGLPTLVLGDGADTLDFPVKHMASPDDAGSDTLTATLIGFLERIQPLVPPEYRSGSDARTLRDAMGVFATGVTIVTAHDPDGKPVGLTANSFTSVSLDPPLLLVCIANTSSNAANLRAAERFAVNVLQIGQQPTSNRFAGKAEDRFADTPWEVGESGSPILRESLGVFECERFAAHEAGDHFVLIGRVIRASFEPHRDPLLYFRGKYRRLHFA